MAGGMARALGLTAAAAVLANYFRGSATGPSTSGSSDATGSSALSGAVKGLTDALAKNTSGLTAVTSALSKLADRTGAAASSPGIGTGATGSRGGPDLSRVGVELPDTSGIKQPSGGGGGGMMSGLMSGLAAATEGLTALGGMAVAFAGLVSPAMLEALSRAFQDTSAAIGVALLPILDMLVGVMRSLGELILPIAEQMAPLFQQLADVIGAQLVGGMELLANLITELMPLFEVAVRLFDALSGVGSAVFEVIGALAEGLAPIITVVVEVLQLVIEPLRFFAGLLADAAHVLKAFLAGLAAAFSFGTDDPSKGLRDVLDQVREGFRRFLETILVITAAIAKFVAPAFGDKFIRGMLASIGKKPEREGTEGLRPASGAQITSMESFGKDLLTRAALAGPGGAAAGKKTEDWLEAIKGDLEGLRDDNTDIVDRIWAKIKDLPGMMARALWEVMKSPFDFGGEGGAAGAAGMAGRGPAEGRGGIPPAERGGGGGGGGGGISVADVLDPFGFFH